MFEQGFQSLLYFTFMMNIHLPGHLQLTYSKEGLYVEFLERTNQLILFWEWSCTNLVGAEEWGTKTHYKQAEKPSVTNLNVVLTVRTYF